jgi:hypothetical protein
MRLFCFPPNFKNIIQMQKDFSQTRWGLSGLSPKIYLSNPRTRLRAVKCAAERYKEIIRKASLDLPRTGKSRHYITSRHSRQRRTGLQSSGLSKPCAPPSRSIWRGYTKYLRLRKRCNAPWRTDCRFWKARSRTYLAGNGSRALCWIKKSGRCIRR